MAHDPILAELRARIARLERNGRAVHPAIPFGVASIDVRLPGGGLARGALHDIADDERGAVHAAAATLFTAGILARLPGPVLWCLGARDLFPAALAAAGLHPDRVIYAEAGGDKAVLSCMEEGLRHPALAAVVGEVSRLSMIASRRLQLAAESSGVSAFVIRRWRAVTGGPSAHAGASAAATRWRIGAAPSSPLPVPGVGRPRWRVELLRCRGGEAAAWLVEGCDAAGRLALPADVANRSAAPANGQRRAFA